MGHILPADRNPTIADGLQPRNAIEQGRFPASRGANKNQKIALIDRNVDIFQNFD